MKNDVSSDFIRFHFWQKINHYSLFLFYQNHLIFSASLEKELSIKTQFASTKIDLTELIAQQNSLEVWGKNIDLSTIAFCYRIDPFPKGFSINCTAASCMLKIEISHFFGLRAMGKISYKTNKRNPWQREKQKQNLWQRELLHL